MHTRTNVAEKTNVRKTRGRGCEVHAVGTADFLFRVGARVYQPGHGNDVIAHYVKLVSEYFLIFSFCWCCSPPLIC